MLPDYEDAAGARLQDPLELRAAPRVAVDVPVQIRTTDLAGPLPGRARDLSVGGVCVATPSPFSLKSVQELTLSLPRGPLRLAAEGSWQREIRGEDSILTGLAFPDPPPEALDRLWELVFSAGRQLARFLHERTQLHELGVEEGLGLAQLSRYREVPAGSAIYRQDTREAGEDSVFVLIEGSVALQVRVRDAVEVEIERLHPGALFGGLPLLCQAPHAESAVAVSDTRLLEIDARSFRYLRTAKPWLGYRLCQALLRTQALRLRLAFTRVRDQL